ncbi:hypothetical protein B0J11DRAFT_459120 [Dendryphion nanum]|uniref:Zn(2)-C6 fungal-type domain-containing protein n=1 Tax=Dendryphion nanum TaxID=256645 RepID=A0A9P9DZW0_9PLEO|nr:hypothetical protein B0J11DRAFT_459120 [Dendryphion nanum]
MRRSLRRRSKDQAPAASARAKSHDRAVEHSVSKFSSQSAREPEPASERVVQNQCSACSKCFSSNSHLRRHQLSHSRHRQYRCPFCNREFLRPDALRRHCKTCTQNDQDERIPEFTRGRRLRACDSCRRKKVTCDGKDPCSGCSSKQIECSYDHVTNINVSSYETGSTAGRIPVRFLLSYTDPSVESIADVFAATGSQPQVLVEHPVHPAPIIDSVSQLYGEDMEGIFSNIFPDLFMEHDFSHNNLTSVEIPTPDHSALQFRIEELLSQLALQHHKSFKMMELTMDQVPISLLKSVFTPTNFTNYIGTFFTYAHPHFPIIHQATFNIKTIPLPLLLAVFLGGAVHAAPQDVALSSLQFSDLSEEYIFEVLRKTIINDGVKNVEGIQIIHAALLICAVQTISNNAIVILQRLRVTRYPVIVDAIRSMGLIGTVRSTRIDAMEWDQFITEESRIRLVTWMFLSDCMNTLFFKSPPQISISEMTGDLPCADTLFEASTATEFTRLARSAPSSSSRGPSLESWISSLMAETWLGPEDPSLNWLEPYHLMMAIFAFHSIIFTSRTNLLASSSYLILLRATNRWREVWEKVKSRQTREQLPPFGFTKYGLELWWLAQKILELAQSNDSESKYMSGAPTNSLQELHEFIRLHGEI